MTLNLLHKVLVQQELVTYVRGPLRITAFDALMFVYTLSPPFELSYAVINSF